jgi:hypothetical protein
MTSRDFKSQERNMNLASSTKDLVLLTTKSWLQATISQPTMFDQWVFWKILHIKKM